MRILMLAPQPYYQERGTPIAIDNVLKVLSERGDEVDVLAYHEGTDVHHNNVVIHRTPALPFLHGIRPGLSWKKLVCDVFMMPKAMRMAGRGRYDLVHAVEEGSLMALALKRLFGIPYVYDMDSSLAQQMVEKYPRLSLLAKTFARFEGAAVRNALAVLPVCDALAEVIQGYGPRRVTIVHDVSLLRDEGEHPEVDLRAELGLSGPVLMYVGNLEPYQGIDLLLDSFAVALTQVASADLVIIGGKDGDIKKFRHKSQDLGIGDRVHFAGPRPVAHLAAYLAQADLLVSPRVKGNNTPMKLYSYLHSGKAVLATDLPTHTQVLDPRIAMLAEPTPEGFGAGIARLVNDSSLRKELGLAGEALIEEKHTFSVLRSRVNELYDWVDRTRQQSQGFQVRL